MTWNNSLFVEMVDFANKSPSVHNVQPWKLKYIPSGFTLFQSKTRRLHVGDPKLHDNDVSLGAFLLLCRIFLNNKGLNFQISNADGIEQPSLVTWKNEECELRFLLTIENCKYSKNDFYDQVKHRKSYRGLFDQADNDLIPLISKTNEHECQVVFITKKEDKEKWAKIYDFSSASILKEKGYFQEFRYWMRFSSSHPQYSIDGLNAKALALGKLEAFFGNLLFKASVFNFLSKFNMEKYLITEAPQIHSAAGLAFIFVNSRLSKLEAGEAFMRFWLDLTKNNFYACPLSAMVDCKETLKVIQEFSPGQDMVCLNVLRYGRVHNENKIYTSPRLDSKAIILQ